MSEGLSQNGDQNSIESRLLELAKSQPEGISNDDVKEHMKDVPLPEITLIINKCLKNG